MLSLKIDIKQFEKDLKAFEDKVQSSLDSTIKQAAEQIVSDAKAGEHLPEMAASISMRKEGNAYVINKGEGLPNPEVGAYSEFGTGIHAKKLLMAYPEDWVVYAWTFKKPKDGRMPANPTIYPAFNRHTVGIADKIAKEIDK